MTITKVSTRTPLMILLGFIGLLAASLLWTDRSQQKPVLISKGPQASHLGTFITDLDNNGLLDMVFTTESTQGFVLEREDPGLSNKHLPCRPTWHPSLHPAIALSGLDHIDIDENGCEEIVVGAVDDSTSFRIVVGWINQERILSRRIPSVTDAKSARVIGWSICRGATANTNFLIVALETSPQKGLVCGFACGGSVADTISLEPTWRIHTGTPRDFLGHRSITTDEWSGVCLCSVRNETTESGQDSLLCLDGSTGHRLWVSRIGHENGGALSWWNSINGKEAVVASGRASIHTEGYTLIRFSHRGEQVGQSHTIGQAIQPPLITSPEREGLPPEMIVGGVNGTVRIYRGSLTEPKVVSSHLADEPVYAIPCREGNVAHIAVGRSSLWLLDKNLRPVTDEIRFPNHLFTQIPVAYQQSRLGAHLMVVLRNQQESRDYLYSIDIQGDDLFLPPRTVRANYLPIAWAMLAGLLIGSILQWRDHVGSRPRPQKPAVSMSVIELHTALRDFRHNQATWRVFRGLSRLLRTLPQREPDDRIEIHELIEQRLGTLRLSSQPALERVIRTAQAARWNPREVESLASLRTQLSGLIGGAEDGALSRADVMERARDLAQVTETLAERLEHLVEEARRERQCDPLLILTEVQKKHQLTEENQSVLPWALQISGNAISQAYIPEGVFRYLVHDLSSSMIDAGPIESGLNRIVVGYWPKTIDVRFVRSWRKPEISVQAHAHMKRRVEEVRPNLDAFGASLALKCDGGELSVHLCFEVAHQL